ncbi:hypothetical protein KAR91_48400 [Candidatus Pacearchaeota archaeon]|nr:hypothetical protein [Candidatus Pacearchaeota archaeon]
MSKYKKYLFDIKNFILDYNQSPFFSKDDKFEAIVSFIDNMDDQPVGDPIGYKLNSTNFKKELKELIEKEGDSVKLASKYGVSIQAVNYQIRKFKKERELKLS